MTRKEELEKVINELHDKDIYGKLTSEGEAELTQFGNEYMSILSKEIAEQRVKDEAKSKEMRNRRKRGRYGEKRVAKEVGGRRDGGVGRKDIISGMFSYEVKSIKTIPASIIKIMEQAERLKKRDTIAVGVFRCNSPRREYFVVERQDWLNLHGKG